MAFTASPALGQVRPEILQRADQTNALAQTRLGLMYDLGWDVPQNDTEAGRWKPILIGAGIGLTVGFGIGWLAYEIQAPEVCMLSHSGGWHCGGRPYLYQFRITGSLVGAGAGAAFGWLRLRGGAAPDQRPRVCGSRRCRLPSAFPGVRRSQEAPCRAEERPSEPIRAGAIAARMDHRTHRNPSSRRGADCLGDRPRI